MRIRIVCVGKLKEEYMRQACADYQKRLNRFCSLDLVELADEKAPERLSEKQRLQLLNREGARIKAALAPGRSIALAIEGRRCHSPGFAEYIAGLEGGGAANFIIGGSLGLCPDLLHSCEKLSLSDLTFPHNMARLLLLEQLYRAMKINSGQVYHK